LTEVPGVEVYMAQGFKSGFVIIVGRPNVGKSTLLNRLVGSKVAIMSDKPQTTRNRIKGIVTTDKAQIIFIDTPGIHKPKHKLGEYMVRTATSSLDEADCILYLVDASAEIGPGEEWVQNILRDVKTPVFLGINKIDLVTKERLAEMITALTSDQSFAEVVPLSAATGENTELLLELLIKYLPEGPKYYPEDAVTDRPEEFVAAEFIREKILEVTKEEVPHAVAVAVEEMEDRGHLFYISANIFVERESQKGIVIGKRGQMLKEIGTLARRDLENLFNCKIFLELNVKVKKGWRKHEIALRQLGYTDKQVY
jgi:GTP-binding protein Era